MTDANFSEWIETFARRVRSHRARVGPDTASANVPVNIIYDLQAAQEELGAAEEELRLQNEQLQAALEQTEAERLRYRELFEFSHDGCLVLDAKGAIVEANQAAGQLLNVPAQYLPGKPLIRCLDAESHGQFRAELRQLQQSHGSSEIMLRIQPRAAASFYGALALTAMLDKSLHLQGVRCVLRDVTAQVKAQREAQAHQEQIQQKLRDQAAQLEETCRARDEAVERERKGRLKAEAAVAARDHLLAGMVHELRTPLIPILASLGSLEADAGSPERMRDTLEMIRRNINVQTQLIEGLMEVARLKCGKLILQRHPLNLHSLLGEAVEVCRSEVAAKALKLTQHLGATDCTVNGDAVRLPQVFWNILKNAVKFSPQDGQLVIATDNSISDHIRVQITDSGAGIPRTMLAKIFEPFEQGDTGAARQSQGLGLGLMIARSMVEAHGGTISAQSEGHGRGATFSVILPLAAQVIATAEPVTAAATAATAAPQASPRILVVDDHRDTLTALARALRAAGYRVQTADTLARALRTLETSHFDVIITDLALPDGSGYDLLARMAAKHNHTAAIALSGADSPADPNFASSAAFAAHLTKPIDFSELQETIERVLA